MLKNFGTYRAKVVPGDIPDAIISVAGVGRPAADHNGGVAMSFEWERTLQRLNRREHIIYLQDTRRSWFNETAGWDELICFIKDYFETNHISRKVALGLSMGATGTIIVDSCIKFDKVIGLSPQALVACDLCPWDDRFFEYRDRIKYMKFPDTSRMIRREGEYQFLFSFDDAIDMRHAGIFYQAAKNVTFSMVRGDHNIGSEMARRNVIDKVVHDLLEGDSRDLVKLGILRPSNYLLDIIGRPDVVDRRNVLEFGLARPFELPQYLYDIFHEECLNDQLDRGNSYDRAIGATPYPVHAAQIVSGGELAHYAVHGWSSDDGWSVGLHHVIRMRVMDYNLFPNARLQLILEPLIHERHQRQRLQVSVGRKLVADVVAEYGEETAHRLLVTVEPLASTVEIYLKTPDCVSPKQIGLNTDIRQLGVRLVGMQLLPF